MTDVKPVKGDDLTPAAKPEAEAEARKPEVQTGGVVRRAGKAARPPLAKVAEERAAGRAKSSKEH